MRRLRSGFPLIEYEDDRTHVRWPDRLWKGIVRYRVMVACHTCGEDARWSANA